MFQAFTEGSAARRHAVFPAHITLRRHQNMLHDDRRLPPPPPRPLFRKYSVVRRNPKLQLELSSKRSLKKKMQRLMSEKKRYK